MKLIIWLFVLLICSNAYAEEWITARPTIGGADIEDISFTKSLIDSEDPVALAEMLESKRAIIFKEGETLVFIKWSQYLDYWYMRLKGDINVYIVNSEHLKRK